MGSDVDRSGDPSSTGRSALDIVVDWYQIPIVALLMGYMLWVRVQSWQSFVQQGQVFFSGNDAWYHYRNVVYVVHHWPGTMPFDSWTFFPYGTSVGQFGTFYDQLIATAALIVSLGHPSHHLVAMTTLFTPPVFGTLSAIPAYYIAKRLGGRSAGVIAVAILAFIPGTILSRSLVGFADHDVAEVFFQAVAVFIYLIALQIAERDNPTWRQVRDRDWTALQPTLGWSMLAGVAAALYMWAWPPGVLLIGILGIFFLLKISSVHYNNKSSDHLALVGTTSMAVATILMLVPLNTLSFSAPHYSLLQPAAALGVLVACVFLAWLSRQFKARDLNRSLYPLAIFGIVVIGAAVVAVVLPKVFQIVFGNFERFVGFNTSAAQRTIVEAQPWLSNLSRYGGSRFTLFFSQYGLAFFVMLAALAWILWRPFYDYADDRKRWFAAIALIVTALIVVFPGLIPAIAGAIGLEPTWTGIVVVGSLLFISIILGDHDADKVFAVVWALFIIATAFTQVQFNNYLAIPVVVLSGYGAAVVFRSDYVNLRATTREWNAKQVVAIIAVFLVLITPLTVPLNLQTSHGNVRTNTARQVGKWTGPGAVLAWNPMLQWMRKNTPQEGNYGGANNAGQLPYYGTYHKTSDYAYPNGSYGVMSWWDYGHWITVLGHRIPDANPFQEGAKYAANYLLAQNESHANQILDSKGGPNEKTRYVAVDWKMASVQSKFSAPTVFDKNVSTSEFYHPLFQVNSQKQTSRLLTYVHTQKYYNSMVVRLYRYEGSAVRPQPTVTTWDQAYGKADVVRNQHGQILKSFKTMAAAKAYVANHSSSSQIGGIGRYPSRYVPALKHYRLVGLSPQHDPSSVTGQFQFSNLSYWAKLYERVPGATVHGTAPANTNVTASVTMYSTQLGRSKNFTYIQRAHTGPNGKFTMTLPYSTTGYDRYGPQNGYTNVSVRATGPYRFKAVQGTGHNQTTWIGNANVAEGQVNGANSSAVSVSLHH